MNKPADLPLAVQLTMTESTQATLRQHEGAVEIANAYDIDSHDMAVAANDELKNFKAAAKKLEEMRKGFVAPAMQIVEHARSMFNPAIQALEEAEVILKGKLRAYQIEQEKIAQAARREAEEAERKARQEAEQKAAAERARAEEQSREAKRKADEAEAARKQAEAEGNARAAAAAAAEAARQQEKAAAAIENGEARAQQVQLTAAAMPAPAPIPQPTKLAGLSVRDDWRAELAPNTDEATAIQAIAAALPARPELIALLKLDLSAGSKMAKALKDHFNVPGLQAVNRQQVASRR